MAAEPRFSRHEKKLGGVYLMELLGAIAVYAVILVLAIKYGKPMAPGPARTALLLAPMTGFVLMIWAVWRMLYRVDEYARRLLLESIALAAAVTLGITFTYGFMEIAGYPKLSMFYVWMLFGGVFMLISVGRALRSR